MSRAADLSSINCTQCGAGLSVLGGGRVLTHVCGYCGAVLDTQDDYKVLTTIAERDHPDSPVRIGQTLTVDGVEFTVIGTIGMQDDWGGALYSWVEHQLFSDTHGYAWLNYERGNFTFTRKIRDFDISQWVSERQVETVETPPRQYLRDQWFKYYETSIARIDFMEGEFNWTPELDEKTTTVYLLGEDEMLGLTEGKTEREVEITRFLPRAEVIEQMGLDLDPNTTPPRHPLTPYRPIREEGFLRRILAVSMILSLLLALVFSMWSGPRILVARNVSLANPQTLGFEVSNTSQLSLMRLDTNLSNAWMVVGVIVRGPNGDIVVEGDRLVQFYSGRDSDGSWTEGSRDADLRFRPRETGPHQLELSYVDGSGSAPGTIDVAINEGSATPIWLFVMAIIFGLGYIAVRLRRAFFNKRRFAGGDWHEE